MSTILQGVLSFMLENEQTTGAIITSDEKKRELAKASHAFNSAHKDFKLLFADELPSLSATANDSAADTAAAAAPAAAPAVVPASEERAGIKGADKHDK